MEIEKPINQIMNSSGLGARRGRGDDGQEEHPHPIVGVRPCKWLGQAGCWQHQADIFFLDTIFCGIIFFLSVTCFAQRFFFIIIYIFTITFLVQHTNTGLVLHVHQWLLRFLLTVSGQGTGQGRCLNHCCRNLGVAKVAGQRHTLGRPSVASVRITGRGISIVHCCAPHPWALTPCKIMVPPYE